jgi:hypothetical protein
VIVRGRPKAIQSNLGGAAIFGVSSWLLRKNLYQGLE